MVEWKKLGDVCEIKGRIGFRGYKREDQVEKGKGAISLSPGNISDGILSYNSCTYITWEKYDESPEIIVNDGDIILCKTASVGKVSRVKKLPEKATINPQLVLLKKFTINPQFLFYILSDYPFQSKIKLLAGIGSVPNVSQAKLSGILIPVPSLSEQNRIVGILDTFSESIGNLKNQITQRRKQYKYLIDQAFGGSLAEMRKKTEDGTIYVEPLSSHGVFTRGRRFVRTDIIEEGQPCIHYGDMYTYYGLCTDKAKTHLPYDFPKKMRYAQKGDVVIVSAGENNEDIGVGLVWQGEEPAAVHDACFIYESDFDPMFLAYFLRSSIYHLQIKSHVVRGKICSISSNGIGKALIPIYPLTKQKEIVDRLYPYESLFDNLQKQLELRQMQYEYYRNKLLTFE